MKPKAEQDRPLRGERILIVEDEFLIAAVLEETFSEAGAETVSAATLAEALKVAEDASLSAAVLDVRLGRQTTEAVADVLAARSVPFVFYSGQDLPDRTRAKYSGAHVLVKPAREDVLVQVILKAVRH
jgi:DNA-binding response OmpR family regulator